MNKPKIRELQKKDIKIITKIMLEFPNAYGKDYVKSRKRGGIQWLLNYALLSKDIFDVRSFVMEIDNKVIGHIAYIKDVRCFEGGVYELSALVIDKKYQKKNYGKQLIKHVEKKLKKINARIIWLQTEGKKEVAYYKKLGYKLVGKWDNYWGINRHRYIMSRDLRS